MAGAGGLTSGAPMVEGLAVVVALSGGPDSAVAGWLSVQHARSVRAVFVDHRSSPEESSPMLPAARAVAAALGIDLSEVAVDVADGPGWEARAREARYRALGRALAEDEWLVTGHTADDQAETVLMNLGRGAGLHGAAGIPARRGRVLRPLLGSRRAEIERLVLDLGLPAVADPSNLDPRFTRNRIRSDVLPAFAKALEPDPVTGLVRFAERARTAAEWVDEVASTVPVSVVGDVARIPLPVLSGLPEPVWASVVGQAVASVRPPYRPTADEIDRLAALAAGEVAVVEMEGGFVAGRSRTHLLVGRRPRVPQPVTWDEGVVAFGDWTLRARPVPGEPPVLLASGARCLVGAGAELVVRAVAPEDTYRVGRGERSGTKSVRSLIAESGVPMPGRPGYPVVFADGRPHWVPGIRGFGWNRTESNGYLLLDIVEEGAWK